MPWDDPATPADEGVVDGETITFKVDGRTAASRTVDAKGTNNRLELTVTTSPTSPSSGGGSSGGGGGGGKSGENTSNIEVIEKYDLQISRDVTTSYRFTNEKNPIMFVNITGNTTLGIITTSVEILKDTSTLVKTPPEGAVYMNANIWVGTAGFATPRNIKEALIRFKVRNSWISENGVSEIALMKWDGNSWIKLETKELSKDDASTYFEGKTNAFSPFAITGVRSAPSAGITAAATGKAETTPSASPTKKAPGFVFFLAIAGLIAAVLRKRSN